jgi:glycosyltransferase involved in cell wall biosynthesis
MPDICFASDIIALTSDQEGTPVSLIEAGAAAVPTVSTNVGGAATVIDHGVTGLLVPPADETGLADALRRLAVDDSLRARMRQNAQAHVLRRFAVDRLIRDLDILYRKLVDKTAGGRASGTPTST